LFDLTGQIKQIEAIIGGNNKGIFGSKKTSQGFLLD
jgi:hypothetical protein